MPALNLIHAQLPPLLRGDSSPETLRQKLSEDPLKYTRFLNVFARLVREIVHLRKFRDASAKAAAARLKKLDPDRDLSDNEFELVVNKMDKVFKVARPVRSERGPSRHAAGAIEIHSDQSIPNVPCEAGLAAPKSHEAELAAPKSDEGGPL